MQLNGVTFEGYAGVVLGAATLLLSGLLPQFNQFILSHESFGDKARLLTSRLRTTRQRAAASGIREVIEDPNTGAAAAGPLAAFIKTEALLVLREGEIQNLVRAERLARGGIAVSVVAAVIVVVLSLAFSQQAAAWLWIGFLDLLGILGFYGWLYALSTRLEAIERDDDDARQ